MPKILNVICNTVLPIILAKKARPTAEEPNNKAEMGKDRFVLKMNRELVALPFLSMFILACLCKIQGLLKYF